MEFTDEALEIFRRFHYKMPIITMPPFEDDHITTPPGAPAKIRKPKLPKLVAPVVPEVDTMPAAFDPLAGMTAKERAKAIRDGFDPSKFKLPTKAELDAIGEKLKAKHAEKMEAYEKHIDAIEVKPAKKARKPRKAKAVEFPTEKQFSKIVAAATKETQKAKAKTAAAEKKAAEKALAKREKSSSKTAKLMLIDHHKTIVESAKAMLEKVKHESKEAIAVARQALKKARADLAAVRKMKLSEF